MYLRKKICMYNLLKEREEIIEILGIHFESLYKIPPLAGRILALLIVDGCKSGLSFENIVVKLAASKSSISTNINLLLKMELIYYITIIGDRKKYFKSAPLSQRLTSYLKMIAFEKQIIDKLQTYRERTIACPEEQFNMQNVKVYKAHVSEVEELLIKTIEKFKKIEIDNSKNNY